MKIIEQNIPKELDSQRDSIIRCLIEFDKAAKIREIRLFGSFARGEGKANSDVDLCIVVDGAEKQLEMAARLRRAVRDVRPKPAFTLVPITPSRLEEKKRSGDHFFRTILEEGIPIAAED